jgi:DNA-binding response OmpR family regulator
VPGWPQAGYGLRVALFDEVPSEGEAVAALLSTEGHDVSSAQSADAFVDMVCNNYFDLSVISWKSHSMLGMDVLNKIRSSTSASSSARSTYLDNTHQRV